MDSTIEERAAAAERWADRNIRFRELLEITGFQRGYIQGIEQRKLWEYGGPEKGTGNWRAYSFKDLLAFELGHILSGAGFDVATAWAIVKYNLDEIIQHCMVLRNEEFTVSHNTIKVVIPGLQIIARLMQRIQNYYGRLEDAPPAALQAQMFKNDHFDLHPEQEFPS